MMAQLYSQSYDTPWSYGEETVQAISPIFPLAGFNFTVTDATTGQPIVGAYCIIYAGINGTGDADGVYTDSQGKAGIDAIWFAPKSWSVSKEGYLQKMSNTMASIINVALESTTIQYTVRIFAGSGGTTNPSGTLTVEPNTQLTVSAIPNSGYEFDYWTYKGQNGGSANPNTFLIDRNAITITASFKTSGEPPNGEPPVEWPVVKTDHVFDNVRLAPGIFPEARQTAEKQVDTSLVLGGQIEYSIKLESSLVTACTYYILWNNEILLEEGFAPWVPRDTIRSGVLNLPLSKIRSTNVLTIVLSQIPGMFTRVLYNVFVTIGYSSEPTEDPAWRENLLDWLMRNAWWITLGTTGTLLTGAIVLGYITERGEKK